MPKVTARRIASARTADGLQTVVMEQLVGTTRYFDAAGFPGRTVGLRARHRAQRPGRTLTPDPGS